MGRLQRIAPFQDRGHQAYPDERRVERDTGRSAIASVGNSAASKGLNGDRSSREFAMPFKLSDHIDPPRPAKARQAVLLALGPPDRHSMLCAMIGGALYFALAVLSLSLFRADGALAAIMWPNAAAVAFLLVTAPRNEVGYCVAIFSASLLANMLGGTSLGIALGYSIANLAAIMLVAWLTRRRCGAQLDMSDPAALTRFVWIGAGAGPLVSASLAILWVQLLALNDTAAPVPSSEPAAWEMFFNWFLGEGMAMVLAVPSALLVHQAWVHRRWPARKAIMQGAVLLAGSLFCTILVFAQSALGLLFLILPLTLLNAFRLGSVGLVLHVALVATVAMAMTRAGLGPVAEAGASQGSQLHIIQAFIMVNCLIGLPITAMLATKDRLTDTLNERCRELALLANTMTDAVLKLDRNGMCTYASPSVRSVFAEEPESLVGRSLGELTKDDASQRITDVLTRLLGGLSDKERLTFHRRIDDAAGAPILIEADCVRAIDRGTVGKEGVIVSARNATGRVKPGRLPTHTRHHAETSSGAKSDFLANTSHAIRKPMNSVLGAAELILRGELSPDQRRHVEMIVESGRSIMLLLNDILDFSKIEAGQIVIDTGPIDLHATLEECLALHYQSARKRGLELRLARELDPAEEAGSAGMSVEGEARRRSCRVITDRLRLRQIVLNLVGNAVKFTQSGEVCVSYHAGDSELRVSVRDTGIGISQDLLERIFIPFAKSENEIAGRFGGTGLGLSISRQLSELLGGRIEVESVPGVGSTFTLFLPATKVEIQGTACEGPRGVGPGEILQEGRILLVEDHEANRMVMTEMLERCGQSVAIAQDGNEALSMVIDSVMRERPFDLVLMDVQMPDCDGHEVTRAIREEGIGPETLPIVALTTNACAQDLVAARKAGMQAHLAKPIVFADLAEVLQRWLPTRIVEAPMDRDLPPVCHGDSIAEARAEQGTGRKAVVARWLERRNQTIEAVRDGLASGLIGNRNRRRARDKAEREELALLIHKLAGTAATFGEPELGEQAAALKEAMQGNGSSGEKCEALAFALLALADEPPRSASFRHSFAG